MWKYVLHLQVIKVSKTKCNLINQIHFNAFQYISCVWRQGRGLIGIFICLQADRPLCLIVLNFFSLTTTLSTIIINSTYRVFLVVRYFLYIVSSASLLFLKKVIKRNRLRLSFKNSEQLCSPSSSSSSLSSLSSLS